MTTMFACGGAAQRAFAPPAGRTLERFRWIMKKVDLDQPRWTDWERGFVTDMRALHNDLGDRLTLTERQWIALEEIAEKAA